MVIKKLFLVVLLSMTPHIAHTASMDPCIIATPIWSSIGVAGALGLFYSGALLACSNPKSHEGDMPLLNEGIDERQIQRYRWAFKTGCVGAVSVVLSIIGLALTDKYFCSLP